MAEELSKARLDLINGVTNALLMDLVGGLMDSKPPVLTVREAHEILQTHQETKDMTGLLVDTVCKKGDQASKSMISILKKKDANVAKCIGLQTSNPSVFKTFPCWKTSTPLNVYSGNSINPSCMQKQLQISQRTEHGRAAFEARLHLIERVNEALLKDLIDGLRAANPPVLTAREANEILQAHKVTEDKTGLLVDMMFGKGDTACAFLMSILEQKVNLAKYLGFIPD